MRKIFMILLCLGLCGCATTAKYEAKLNNFLGADEDALVASWGIPSKTYNLADGKKALEFLDKETYHTGGYTTMMPQETNYYGKVNGQTYSGTATTYAPQAVPYQKIKVSCKTTFIFNSNGKVESWHHVGNNCISN